MGYNVRARDFDLGQEGRHEHDRPVKRHVVVAAVPDQDVALGLGPQEDVTVVHAGVHDGVVAKVRLVDSTGKELAYDDDSGARLPRRATRFGSVDLSRAWGRWTAGLAMLASGDRFDRLRGWQGIACSRLL